MSLFGKAKVEKIDIKKRYELLGRIGQGSMSKVWRAEDKMDSRSIAVKVLDGAKTRKFEDRFKGLNKPPEQEIATRLNHPYIVKTLDTGITTEDEPFLIMEFVEGSGLSLLVDLQSEQMKRHRMRYMIQIGESLVYFHDQGWIHRDLCPRNIMVTEKDEIRLIDFGLTVPNTPDFQRPGNRTGTANYLAPELIKRQQTDHRLDIFSYAVTCYEMYSKRHPWEAALTLEAVMHHINKPPLPIQELVPNIHPKVAEIIMKGLESDRERRWSTAQEMVDAFREVEPELIQQTKAWLKSTGQSIPGVATEKATGKSKPSPPRKAKSGGKQRRQKPTGTDDEIASAFLSDDDDLMSFAADESERSAAASKPEPKARPSKSKAVGKKKKMATLQSETHSAEPKAATPDASNDSAALNDEDDILALPDD